MFSLKDTEVLLCERKEIKDFIEDWHYSKSINGIMSEYCFKIMYDNVLVGAMIFGALGMANAWKKYGDNKEDVIELRRLCCIDETPRNIESYFIGKSLNWLKKNTSIKIIVSYADPEYGHQGVIYKASNFELIGMSSKGRVIIWNGKKYHDKTIRTTYKGKIKPFAQRVKDALDRGEAYYKKTEGKYIYVYDLDKRR